MTTSANGQDEPKRLVGHRNNWFQPDRPVAGGTVFVRPVADVSSDVSPAAPVERNGD